MQTEVSFLSRNFSFHSSLEEKEDVRRVEEQREAAEIKASAEQTACDSPAAPLPDQRWKNHLHLSEKCFVLGIPAH